MDLVRIANLGTKPNLCLMNILYFKEAFKMIRNQVNKIVKMLVCIGIAYMAINFETVGIAKAEPVNIVVPSENMEAPLAQVTNISGECGSLDTNGETGRGYVVLHWTPVSDATGYKVYVYDGHDYRGFDVGNVTKWDSRIAKIYPPESTLNSKVDDSATDDLFVHGRVGLDLMNSPQNLYRATQGLENNTNTHYMFRVTSYRKNQESVIDYNAGYRAQLIDTTIKTDNSVKLTGNIVATLAEDLASVSIKCTGYGGKGEVIGIRKPDGVIWQGNTLSYTVYDNGEYNFTIIDSTGQEAVVTANASGIQLKPIIVILNINNKMTSNLNFSRNDAAARYTFCGYSWDAEPTKINNALTDGKIAIMVDFVGTRNLYIKFKNAAGQVMNSKFEITITEGTSGGVSVQTKRL